MSDHNDILAHILDRELHQYLEQSTLLNNTIIDRDIWREEAMETNNGLAASTVELQLAQHQLAAAQRMNTMYQRENNALYMFIRHIFRRYPALQERHEELLAQLLAGAEPNLYANEVIDLTDE